VGQQDALLRAMMKLYVIAAWILLVLLSELDQWQNGKLL